MNHVRWAAWGVIDIETLERMQRRNYIKRTRAELSKDNITLSCGGSSNNPWYAIILPTPDGRTIPQHAVGGEDAFKKVCGWLLKELGDHERSEDGGVRRAGA